ncbi:MAG: glycosyltransferase family 2 protein [Nanoarchaeota archaeon]|nr:glycosyltransferase family 2 protein [Nanoarchaeota archaeon]
MISLVIPAFNEETGLQLTVDEALRFVDEILIIDDGSTDRTGQIAHELSSHHPKIKVFTHEKNLGKAQALRTGVEHAHGDIIVFTDADFTHPAEFIPSLVLEIENGADLAIGERVSRPENKIPFFNRIGNVIFSVLISYVGCSEIRDGQCGFRAFKKDDFKSLDVYARSLEYETKMTVNALKKGYDVIEVPIIYRSRKGSSKLKPISDGFRMLKAIASIAYRQTTLIARLMMASSFFMGMIGLIFGLISIYERIVFLKLINEYYPLITVFLIFLSVQLFSMAIVMDHMTRKMDRIYQRLR